jgi:multiple sugar transport system substrate-binding protein
VGAVIIPGSRKVLDRKSGKLVDCDAKTCPHAIDGVNHAPFAAFGGWSGAVNKNKDQKVKDAAYAFLSYMSQPEQANVDVTIGRTGFNPYRTSQFEGMELWEKAGMSEKAAQSYLGAIKDSLNSPNMVLDLRVPQNQRYQQVVLDTALHRMLSGETTPDETVKEIEQGWNEISDELGRDTQYSAYLNSLGVKR